jgi:hypothetical protein
MVTCVVVQGVEAAADKVLVSLPELVIRADFLQEAAVEEEVL